MKILSLLLIVACLFTSGCYEANKKDNTNTNTVEVQDYEIIWTEGYMDASEDWKQVDRIYDNDANIEWTAHQLVRNNDKTIERRCFKREGLTTSPASVNESPWAKNKEFKK